MSVFILICFVCSYFHIKFCFFFCCCCTSSFYDFNNLVCLLCWSTTRLVCLTVSVSLYDAICLLLPFCCWGFALYMKCFVKYLCNWLYECLVDWLSMCLLLSQFKLKSTHNVACMQNAYFICCNISFYKQQTTRAYEFIFLLFCKFFFFFLLLPFFMHYFLSDTFHFYIHFIHNWCHGNFHLFMGTTTT